MRADERQMLTKLAETVDRVEQDIAELIEFRRAFMDLPMGAHPDEKPLLVDLRNMVNRSKFNSRVFRLSSITIPGFIGVLIYYQDIVEALAGFLNRGDANDG